MAGSDPAKQSTGESLLYQLTHSFRVDAYGRLIQPRPMEGMEAAARYYHARDYAEAERCCRKIIEHEPEHFDALHLLGVVLLDQLKFDEAVEYLNLAVQERQDESQVHYHLGNAYLGLKRPEDAEAEFRQSLTLKPENFEALNNLGNALSGQRRHEEAIEYYRQVLELRRDHAPAYYNLGRSLFMLDRLEDAVTNFQRALSLSTNSAPADKIADIYASLGEALVNLGQYENAFAACRQMATFNPHIADWNESLILLLLGQYAKGWQKYESRWSVPDHDELRQDARMPALSEVAGKRILLISEQGMGDIIQFARYAPLLADTGARVTLQTYIELKSLMQTLAGVEAVITPDETEPSVDIVTPLLSLPFVFGTDLHSVPSDVPYLSPPPDRLTTWQQRLGKRSRPRIGVVWWGSQHIPKRSMPIESLQLLVQQPGVEFHALQKDISETDRKWLSLHPLLADHSAELHDFADTAALISCMDLVVTIDTAVAHLAGALAKPTWIMLAHAADWRWLLNRDDSPWYPTVRLFRQHRRGDWDSVIVEVASALSTWLDAFEH